MQPSPFFTILTSSLNMGDSLIRTLESIQKQRFQSLEHIVVDAKSTDNTLEILKSFETSYNLTWISETDQGVPDAFNKGMRLARGLYIIAIQADDYLLNEMVLEKVYKIISSKKSDIYSFPIIKEIPAKENKQINPIPLLWWIRFRNIFPHQGVFVHKRVFEKIGHFDINYTITEDYDFFYRALNAKCKVIFESMPVAFMGGKGPSSMDHFLATRLREEFLIQAKNEKNPFWRLLQFLFWVFYYPYKIKLNRRCIAGISKYL
jgi:glycosyltransferase involved in cell wall biosynthesis